MARSSVLPSAAVAPRPDLTLPPITLDEVEQLLREVRNILTTAMTFSSSFAWRYVILQAVQENPGADL